MSTFEFLGKNDFVKNLVNIGVPIYFYKTITFKKKKKNEHKLIMPVNLIIRCKSYNMKIKQTKYNGLN